MISPSQIRETIAEFLERRIDLNSFEDWIVRYTWNVHKDGSVAAENLTFAVEEALSEYSNRELNENDLRSALSKILGSENKVIEISAMPYRPKARFRTSAPATLVSVRG